MTDRFIAIRVGQGDAFYLQKNDIAILVDGGLSEISFPIQFESTVKRKSVDYLICTHNDADHANGVLGFLKSHLSCSEVWLPASWSYRLKDLLSHPDNFICELVEEIYQTCPSDEDQELAKFDTTHDIQNDSFSKNESTTDSDVFSEINERYDIEYILQAYNWWNKMEQITLKSCTYRSSLFFQSISAAERIRNIAVHAYRRGFKIRWFEHTYVAPSGGESFLKPVNSRELKATISNSISALSYIALTESNKRSLVFESPENETSPAVLFTADSDLRNVISVPWSNHMIVTSPHHGAESNNYVYQAFSRTGLSKVHWVRSDCRSTKRPGRSYLGVSGVRRCTRCNAPHVHEQDIRFSSSNGVWISKSRLCSCR